MEINNESEKKINDPMKNLGFLKGIISEVSGKHGISEDQVKSRMYQSYLESGEFSEYLELIKPEDVVMPVLGSSKSKKNILKVPKDIRYISDWKDYTLEDYQFQHILDKKIPGCGYTEYAITCGLPMILCSPRKILLQNKKDKHGSRVHYFCNILEDEINFSKDLNIPVNGSGKIASLSILKELDESSNVNKPTDSEIKENMYLMKSRLLSYLENCKETKTPPKILVTYDSFRLVKEVLVETGLLQFFWTVVDEFQSIFTDSKFKATTELDFLWYLKDVQNVCFVSATPMVDDYLVLLDYFDNIPRYEFDWESEDPGRCIKPLLHVRRTRSIVTTAHDIIDSYRKGSFETGWDPVRGEWVKSKEAVIYVNSIKSIITIIKRNKLAPEEVNILCANTSENRDKIKKKLGLNYEIGTIPLLGEPHKMITLCTRTVYLGADFMSDNARTFVLSDANIDSLSVDISLDLPQILGRQRLECNPFRDSAEFWYIPRGKDNRISKSELDSAIKKKMDTTKIVLESNGTEQWSVFVMYITDNHKNYGYLRDYLSVSRVRKGVEFNKLVLISEMRAFDIQQVDYSDRFSVFNKIVGTGMRVDSGFEMVTYLKNPTIPFYNRLKEFCETDKYTDSEKKIIAREAGDPFDKYYNGLGPERCKSLAYNTTSIRNEIKFLSERGSTGSLEEKIYEVFKSGESYLKSWSKSELLKIYQELGINKKPKASDLGEYFELHRCTLKDPRTGKFIDGYRLGSKTK